MATTGAPHELDDELRDDRLEGALHTWRDYDRRRRAFSSSDLFMLFTLFMQSNESGPPNLEDRTGDRTGPRFRHESHGPNRMVEPNPHGRYVCNGRCRTRTCGHLRVRQALYQLS
jgi:hypothetical protein